MKMKCSRCNTVFQHALVEGSVPEDFEGPAPRTLAGIPAITGPATPLAGGQTTIYQPGEPPSWGGVHQPDVTQSPSSGRPGSLTGFDDLFRSSSGKQVTAATDGAAAVVAPADGQPRRSALDELASMGADSAAPFMDDFLGGGSTGSRPRATSGDVQSTVALASGTVAPAPPPPVAQAMTNSAIKPAASMTKAYSDVACPASRTGRVSGFSCSMGRPFMTWESVCARAWRRSPAR